MTPLAIVWTIALSISLFKKNEWIVILVFFSTLLQSAAYLKIGGSEISYLMISVLFLVFKTLLQSHTLRLKKWSKTLLLFFMWAVIVGFVAPIIFPNVKVLYLLNGNFTVNEISQISFPFMKYINLFVIYIGMICVANLELNKIQLVKSFICINAIIVLIALVHYFSVVFNISGVFNFLAENIYNSNSAEMYGSYASTYYSFTSSNRPRAIGTFLEASYFGAYLAATIWTEIYLIIQNKSVYKKWVVIPVMVVNCLTLILNMSSTGIATFALGGCIFFIIVSGRKKLSIIILCTVAALIFFANSTWISKQSIYQDVYTMIFEKIGTNSETVRTRWTTEAWRVVGETFGFGVGIQRTRAGTLFVNILVQTGIVGFILYCKAYFNLLVTNFKKRINPINLIAFMYSIVLLMAQMLSCPHLDFAPYAFGLLLLSVGSVSDKNISI